MIDPSRYDRPGSHLAFYKVKIQHAHGQKMIDPPSMTDQDLTLNFKVEIQHTHGQKMIDTPQDDRPGSCLEFYS